MATTSLSQKRSLIIGHDDLSQTIQARLEAAGITNIVTIDADVKSAVDENGQPHRLQVQPEEYVQTEPEKIKSFDIVIAVNQPRSVELLIGDLRWPDLPLIITRSNRNTCKMRCQYRELSVDGGNVVQYIPLRADLPPWDPHKEDILVAIVDELQPSQYPRLQAYFQSALAALEFRRATGVWPEDKDLSRVLEILRRGIDGSSEVAEQLVGEICHAGLSAIQETSDLLAHVICHDSVKLLTGGGEPVNCTSLDNVIRVSAGLP